jgi:two-component system CAI-1 autoinducer sensor kinase/phosphatase CqsS
MPATVSASGSWFDSMKRLLFANDYAGYSRINRPTTLAWLAIIGFPLYYWIWASLFPQPYENLPLRLIGMGLAIPLLFAKCLSQKRWFQAYFYMAFTYAFPFFFTFMFFMNQGSSVWSQSLLIAIFVLIHLDLKIVLLSTTVGVSMAYVAYVVVTGQYSFSSEVMVINLPIIAFAILTVSILKVGRRILADEKLHGMASALGVISHELRTPLLSVDASAHGVKRYLPALISFYEKNRQLATNDVIPAGRAEMIQAALDRIQAEVQYMNSAIDLLLANAGDTKTKAQITEVFQIHDLIVNAIGRYPFENEHQRSLVNVDTHSNYKVAGNEDLCVMVLFNLLKNALRAIARARKGEIKVVTESDVKENRLIIRDTGCGIPASELPKIFHRFHSYPTNAGTGIGLAFVSETLAAWGAKITCHSQEDFYTEFVIRFPVVEPGIQRR